MNKALGPAAIVATVLFVFIIVSHCTEPAEGITEISSGITVSETDYFREAEEKDADYIRKSEVIYETEYDRIVGLIETAAEINELDANMMIAIWRLETGNGASAAFLEGHNFFGATGKDGLYEYKNEVEGIEAFVRCMKWYRDNGMVTPEEMQPTFCPPNDQWDELIEELMKEN